MKRRRIEGWRWVLLRQRAFFHPPPSARARTVSFACPDMLITSSVCSPVICLFVCFSFPLLVNSSQWDRRQRRESSGWVINPIKPWCSWNLPPLPLLHPLPRQRGIQHKGLLPWKGSISGCTRVRLIAIYTQGRLSAEEEESKNTCWVGLCTAALMHNTVQVQRQVCTWPKGRVTVRGLG